MESWKELWLHTLDVSIYESQCLIKDLQSLKCCNEPVIKQTIKQERESIRRDMIHKKKIYRRYKQWQAKQTIGKND